MSSEQSGSAAGRGFIRRRRDTSARRVRESQIFASWNAVQPAKRVLHPRRGRTGRRRIHRDSRRLRLLGREQAMSVVGLRTSQGAVKKEFEFNSGPVPVLTGARRGAVSHPCPAPPLFCRCCVRRSRTASGSDGAPGWLRWYGRNSSPPCRVHPSLRLRWMPSFVSWNTRGS